MLFLGSTSILGFSREAVRIGINISVIRNWTTSGTGKSKIGRVGLKVEDTLYTTIMVDNAGRPLLKQLTSQRMKCSNKPKHVQFRSFVIPKRRNDLFQTQI